MIFNPKVQQHEGKVGGLFYFFSLISVVLLAALLSRFLLQFYFLTELPQTIGFVQYLICLILGILCAAAIPGKLSVFIHEFKHSLLSGLAGNRSKGMKYFDQTGHFEYTYTKNTAHLNAFISLAPYIVPVFSTLALVVYCFFLKTEPLLMIRMLLVTLGIDLFLNFKDAGIHQTDLTEVRGGYSVSMIYVFAFNLAWISIISLLAFYGPASLLEFVSWLATNIFLILNPEG